MPNWAAAPISISFGLEMSAEKSVIAPMPRKMSGGYQPDVTPWYKMFSTDPCS